MARSTRLTSGPTCSRWARSSARFSRGEPAFLGRGAGEIQRKAALGDLADAMARLDGCGADSELVALAKRCLAREADDRPRSAGAVAERMTAYLAGVQNKLRQAELDRVEERARRRLTTVAAAALILLGLAGGGGYVWNQQQKSERVAKTARAVDEALADAARLRGEAQAAPPGETARWAEALSAAKRAEGLLAQGEADAPLRGRVTALLAQLDSEQAAAAEKARRPPGRPHPADRARIGPRQPRRARRTNADRRRVRRRLSARPGSTSTRPNRPRRASGWRQGPSRSSWPATSTTGPLSGEMQYRPWPTGGGWSQPHGRPTPTRRATPSAPGSVPKTPTRSPSSGGWPTIRRPSMPSRPGLILLARQLKVGADDRERAARVLRRAVSRHPADFWAHFELDKFMAPIPDYRANCTLSPRSRCGT